MKKTLKIEVDVEIVEENDEFVARIYYPKEGNKITLTKGLAKIQVSHALCHELGHLIDWYITEGKQVKKDYLREEVADNIGKVLLEQINK